MLFHMEMILEDYFSLKPPVECLVFENIMYFVALYVLIDKQEISLTYVGFLRWSSGDFEKYCRNVENK